jgi:hypothetical protein
MKKILKILPKKFKKYRKHLINNKKIGNQKENDN